MNLLSDIEKIQSKTFLLSFFSLMFLVVPGTSVIFLFAPSMYSEMEILKIILLSIGIILPFFIINMFVIFISGRNNKFTSPTDFLIDSTGSLFFSSIVIYIGMLFSYLVELNTFGLFVSMTIFQLFFSVFLYFTLKQSEKTVQN